MIQILVALTFPETNRAAAVSLIRGILIYKIHSASAVDLECQNYMNCVRRAAGDETLGKGMIEVKSQLCPHRQRTSGSNSNKANMVRLCWVITKRIRFHFDKVNLRWQPPAALYRTHPLRLLVSIACLPAYLTTSLQCGAEPC